MCEREEDIETEGQCCRVIGIYLVGSRNSPTAAPPSLGNFLSPRDDLPGIAMYSADLYFHPKIIVSITAPRLVLLFSPASFSPLRFFCNLYRDA